MSHKPVFVLGVGAQRSGTTWLHRSLKRLPQASMGPIKEYRIWDVLHTHEGREASANWAEWWHRPKKAWLRRRMRGKPGYYEDFFQHQITARGKTLTGDITPYYALLNGAQFSDVNRRLSARGFDVRVVFFVRDPVARVSSAVRYFRQSAGGRRQKSYLMTAENSRLSETALIEKAYRDPHFTGLTRYEHTLAALDSVFSPEQVFVGCFENLFTVGEQQRLADFLNLSEPLEGWSVPVNASSSGGGLDRDLAQRIAQYYRSTYAYCAQRLPETRVLWRPIPD